MPLDQTDHPLETAFREETAIGVFQRRSIQVKRDCGRIRTYAANAMRFLDAPLNHSGTQSIEKREKAALKPGSGPAPPLRRTVRPSTFNWEPGLP